MRNKIFGVIGVLWGGAILFRWLTSGNPSGSSSAYQAGQSGAAIFGALMFGVGMYCILRKPS